MRRDIVQLLGTLGSNHALGAARELLSSNDLEDRFCGTIVLGWIGQEDDFEKLTRIMKVDPNPLVRGYAATALNLMLLHIPGIKDRAVDAIIAALRSEKDDDAIMKLVVSLQYFSGKNFGIRENINERTLKGNPIRAKEKALRDINTLKKYEEK